MPLLVNMITHPSYIASPNFVSFVYLESFSDSTLCESPCAANLTYGMRYVVADCGGGTVDLTVHELEINGKLKELYKATGGAWGSIGVDCQFEMLLVDIFGEKFLFDFVQTYPISWLELISSFETKKRAFNPQKQIPTNISLPFAFIDHLKKTTGKSIESVVRKFEADGIKWTSQGMLRLQPSVMFSLFEPVVDEVVLHIQHLLNIPELSPIKYLFLVGGFAESPTLQEAIQKAFQHTLKVIIPQNVSLTILKGAVMFGQDPSLIHVRRSALTYGVGCLNPFIPGKHPPEKRVVKDGVEWCTGLFDTFVFADQAVSLGHTVTRSYTLAQENKQSTKITVYASEKGSVQYVTDPGCEKVGEMRLEMPTAAEGRCKEVRMTMMFGDTEISVEAVDATSGQTTRASIDFLNK